MMLDSWPADVKWYWLPPSSISVQVPPELCTSASGLPNGGAYVPLPFWPNRSSWPSGMVTTTFPEPSLSGRSAVSITLDHPAPNAPEVLGSRLL